MRASGRVAAKLNEETRKLLLAEFAETAYIDDDKEQELATATGLTRTQVKKWFSNERSRLRRQAPLHLAAAKALDDDAAAQQNQQAEEADEMNEGLMFFVQAVCIIAVTLNVAYEFYHAYVLSEKIEDASS